MKKLLLVSLVVVLGFTVSAQNVFNKGSVLFNAGIGVPVSLGFIPTVNFSGEVGAIPTGDVGIVSFGGITEFQFAVYSWDNKIRPYFIIGPRAAWHLQVFSSDMWDVYGGVGTGIAFRGEPYDAYYNSNITAYGEGFVGGRMMFNEGFGLFAEVGGGTRSFLKFGLTFGF